MDDQSEHYKYYKEYCDKTKEQIKKLYNKINDVDGETSIKLFKNYYLINKSFFEHTNAIHNNLQEDYKDLQILFENLWIHILSFRTKLLKNFSFNQELINEIDKEMDYFIRNREKLSNDTIIYLVENIRRQFFLSLLQGNKDKSIMIINDNNVFLNIDGSDKKINIENNLMHDTINLIYGKETYFDLLNKRDNENDRYKATLDLVWERFIHRNNCNIDNLDKEKYIYSGSVSFIDQEGHSRQINGEIFIKDQKAWIIPDNTSTQIEINKLLTYPEIISQYNNSNNINQPTIQKNSQSILQRHIKIIKDTINNNKISINLHNYRYKENDEFLITYLHTLSDDRNDIITDEQLGYIKDMIDKLSKKMIPTQKAEVHSYLAIILDKYITNRDNEKAIQTVTNRFHDEENDYKKIILKHAILGDFYNKLINKKDIYTPKVQSIARLYINILEKNSRPITNELTELEFITKELLHQVEIKDIVTHKHVHRMTNFSDKILKNNSKLKNKIFKEIKNYLDCYITDTDIEKIIKICIYLHDIGKLHIPDFIQDSNHKKLWQFIKDSHKNKEPVNLQSEMNTHSSKGGELLQSLKPYFPHKLLDLVISIAHNHHKSTNFIDTKEPNIKNFIHFIKIIDALEACTANRPYRQHPMTEKEINKELNKKTKYDQDTVKKILNIPDIMKIKIL